MFAHCAVQARVLEQANEQSLPQAVSSESLLLGPAPQTSGAGPTTASGNPVEILSPQVFQKDQSTAASLGLPEVLGFGPTFGHGPLDKDGQRRNLFLRSLIEKLVRAKQ